MIKKLYEVFEHQADLMAQLAPKERENGYEPPEAPLDLQDRSHQQHFRLMAWFFTEEIVESLMAEDFQLAEELSDVLHFGVELCILAGVTPERVALVSSSETIFRPDLVDVLIFVGRAVNLMKAKPWKSHPQATPEVELQNYLSVALAALLKYIQAQHLDFHQIYFHKNQINKKRIQNQY